MTSNGSSISTGSSATASRLASSGRQEERMGWLLTADAECPVLNEKIKATGIHHHWNIAWEIDRTQQPVIPCFNSKLRQPGFGNKAINMHHLYTWLQGYHRYLWILFINICNEIYLNTLVTHWVNCLCILLKIALLVCTFNVGDEGWLSRTRTILPICIGHEIGLMKSRSITDLSRISWKWKNNWNCSWQVFSWWKWHCICLHLITCDCHMSFVTGQNHTSLIKKKIKTRKLPLLIFE